MSKAALSVFVFGIYLLVLGFFMLVLPNFLLGLLSFPTTSEVWIRLAGMLVLYLGVFYTLAGRNELTIIFHWTVYLRFLALLIFISFVLQDFVKPQLILFGFIEVLGAVWTFLALRSPQKIT